MWTKKNIDLIPAFIFPVVIFSLVMITFEVYPFGERSINNLDLFHQYLPIMSELQRKLHRGSSIFYSFNGGLGTNFYSLSTYQNASPLTWIFLMFFREEHIVQCAITLILVRIGLISASMNWYLRDSSEFETLRSEDRLIKIMLSVMFSLSGYVVGYYTNLMWLDGMILTPLCIAGLKRSINQRGNTLYIISLALLLFSNYYIGALVCIFIVLYFFTYLFCERKIDIVKTTARIFGYSLISALMSMIVLLPTAISLRKTESFATIGSGFTNLLYQSIPDHIKQLLPASNVTVLDGPPNLYTGLICLLLLALYSLRKDIDNRKKVIRIGLIVLVFISTNFIPLDLIWHFMHAPYGFPARYSFLLAFLLIEIAAEMLENLETFQKRDIAKAYIFVAVLYVISLFGNEWKGVDKRFMYIIGVILIALYSFVMIIMQSESSKVQKEVIASVILFEIITVTFRGIGVGNIVYTEKYLLYHDEVSQLIEIAEEKAPYTRMELLGSENLMPPYVYDFRGTSIFASSVPKSTYDTLKTSFPSGSSNLNAFTFKSIDPKKDSRFGIQYYISIDGEFEDHHELIEVSHFGTCFLYENPYSGAIGYMLLNDALLHIEKMDGNCLIGSIDTPESGVLLLTIPYEEGWHVKLDDNRLAYLEQVDGFISFAIEKGKHTIDMKFIPPGFITGSAISILGFAIFFLSLKRAASRNNKLICGTKKFRS